MQYIVPEPGRSPAPPVAQYWPLMTSSRQRWAAGALCLLLAIVHTWPLATAPRTLSRTDNGDALLNAWILAWVAHQLPRAPARLFDGNIFHPARDTLAFSEPLIVPALIGAPVRWLGGSPVLVFNLTLILGFALTAWAGFVVVRQWTGRMAAGLLAGSMFAFNTHTLTRLAHIQGIHAWGLPLALLAADRLLVSARVRDALWLALWMAAMAYTSGYLAVFGAVLVAVALGARLPWWWRRAPLVLSRVALAASAAGLAVVPLYLPYRRVALEQGMVRSLDDVAAFSAPLEGYLASAGRLHYALWSEPLFRRPLDAFFPGLIVVALAMAAVAWTVARRQDQPDPTKADLTRQRIVMLVAIAAAGLVLSLGTQTPLYGWVFELFPPIRGLRAAARFGNLFLLGMSALAGFGLAMLLSRMPARRAAVVAAVTIALANAESLRAPFAYARFDGIPNIYSLVARLPGPVVLVEIPFYPPGAAFANAAYVLNSTAHFWPLLNGYSGYIPDSYSTLARDFASFPDQPALDAMRRAGVTHVMVHPSRLDRHTPSHAQLLARVAASPRLERLAVGREGITLYRLHP